MFLRGNSLGLEIYQGGVSWVMASGSHSAPVIERFEISQVDKALLLPSIKERNVSAPELLSAKILESYQKLGTDLKRVSISIPDRCGRVMVMEMDAKPKDKEEGIEQLKWKLKKSFPAEIGEFQLDYHLLSENETGGGLVLTAIAAKNVIEEYEGLLTSIGLEPWKIDFSTFNLYRLFADRLEAIDQLLMVISFRGNLSIMVFQDGQLDFFRSKFLADAITDPVRFYRELSSSLLVYSDQKGGWHPQKVFYYAESGERVVIRSVIFETLSVEPLLIDTDAIIGNSRQKVERATLPDILCALGAASRGLR